MRLKSTYIRWCLGISVLAVSIVLVLGASGCYRPAEATVTEVSLNYGPVDGEQEVTVRGSGFSASGAVTDVIFGHTSCLTLQIVSDTELKVIAPAHAPGVVDVMVVGWFGPSETGTMRRCYAYLEEPSIKEILPQAEAGRPGTSVTICGKCFQEGLTCVTFNGVPAKDVVVTDYCHLTATIPELGPGPVEVAVTNSGYGTATRNGLFILAADGTVTGWSNSD